MVTIKYKACTISLTRMETPCTDGIGTEEINNRMRNFLLEVIAAFVHR